MLTFQRGSTPMTTSIPDKNELRVVVSPICGKSFTCRLIFIAHIDCTVPLNARRYTARLRMFSQCFGTNLQGSSEIGTTRCPHHPRPISRHWLHILGLVHPQCRRHLQSPGLRLWSSITCHQSWLCLPLPSLATHPCPRSMEILSHSLTKRLWESIRML